MSRGNNNFQRSEAVSLREFFTEKIEFLSDTFTIRFNHFQEVMNRNNESTSKALELQTIEIERRLNNLNNEGVRIQQVLSQSVPREVHTQDVKEIRGLIEKQALDSKDFVTKEYLASILKTPSEKIEGLTSYRDVSSGKASQNSVLISYAIGGIGILIALYGLLQ